MTQIKKCVCPHDCPDACGMLAVIEDGRITSMKGDPEHQFTQGFLCAKGIAYPHRIYSSKRVLEPLLRSGPKGSGEFEPIGWDQALDLVEESLRRAAAEQGPESIAPYSYAGSMGQITRNAGHAFFHKLGASRLEYTICSSTATEGFNASLGGGPCTDIEQTADSDLIIIWGSNTLSTNQHAWPFFRRARGQGAGIVVIDPYENQTARRADLHIKLKPGTDAALALGMMRVLVDEDLLDYQFIAGRTVGFKRLKKRIRGISISQASEITGVSSEKIKKLALDYGRARAPFIRTGWGPSRQLKGGMAMRTIALLPALVGAFDLPQAGISRSTSGAKPLNLQGLTRPDLAPPDARIINMVQLGRALTELNDPPVRHLHVYLSNPAAVAPDSSRVLAGLARDDLFTVVHEHFITDTARYADLILPGTTFVEETDIYNSYGHYYLQVSPRVIEPLGLARDNLTVFQDLARRFGFDEPCFTASREELIQGFLEVDSPLLEGMTYQRLSGGEPVRANIPSNPWDLGFATPSGKVEFYSQTWADQGLDPLPDPTPSIDDQDRERFPLQLITPPRKHLLNSSFNEVDDLLEKAGPPTILIHPQDAAQRDLTQGQTVRVFNGRGEMRIQADISEAVLPGVTVVEGIYWPSLMPGGKGVNQLTSQQTADIGGSSAFHCNLVEVAAC